MKQLAILLLIGPGSLFSGWFFLYAFIKSIAPHLTGFEMMGAMGYGWMAILFLSVGGAQLYGLLRENLMVRKVAPPTIDRKL